MKQPIKLFELWQETINALTRDGLLLCSVGAKGNPNVMTIGWMTGGEIWSKPIIIVLVRPSRWTYSRLAEVPEFTVNVLPPEMIGCGAILRDGIGPQQRQVRSHGVEACSRAASARAHHRAGRGALRVPHRAHQ